MAKTHDEKVRITVGTFCLLGTCFVWVGSSYVTQFLIQESIQPLLLALICSSTFSVLLPGIKLRRYIIQLQRSRSPQSHAPPSADGLDSMLDVTTSMSGADSTEAPLLSRHPLGKLSVIRQRQRDWHVFQAAVLVTPIWFLAQATFAQSLAYTSVASNTILSSTSTLFTLLGSWLLLHERPSLRTTLGVLLCIAGVAAITLSDDESAARGGGSGVKSGEPGVPSHWLAQLGLGQDGQGVQVGGRKAGGLWGDSWLGRAADDVGSYEGQYVGSGSWRLPTSLPPQRCSSAWNDTRWLAHAASVIRRPPAPPRVPSPPAWSHPPPPSPLPSPSPAPAGGGGGDGDGPGGGPAPPPLPLLGDALSLLSAALYALYTVIMRYKLQPYDDNRADSETTLLFFGYIGLLALGVLLPLVVVGLVDALPFITAVAPAAFGLACVQGLLDYVLADFLWARAVLLLSPTIATAGLTLQIPFAALIDAILGRAAWAAQPGTCALFLVGTVAVIAGFLGCLDADSWEVLTAAARKRLAWLTSAGGGGEGGGAHEVRAYHVVMGSGDVTPEDGSTHGGVPPRGTHVVVPRAASVNSGATLAVLESALCALRVQQEAAAAQQGGTGVAGDAFGLSDLQAGAGASGMGLGGVQGGRLHRGASFTGTFGRTSHASRSSLLNAGEGLVPISADQEDDILEQVLSRPGRFSGR